MEMAGLLQVKAYLTRIYPVLVATVTPFIIGVIKHKRPDWRKKYRDRWPYIAAGIGIALNLCGLAVSPEIVFADSTGIATIDPMTSVATSAAIGYVSALGGAKQRDLKKGRTTCNKSNPIKKGGKKNERSRPKASNAKSNSRRP